MMNGWNSWQMAGWGWVWMLVSTVLILTVVVLLVRSVARSSAQPRIPGEADPALRELRRRFAAGEIDQDEFDRRRAALDG